ncbi:MAG: hypothetical protein F6K28_38995 [Microcoleus sp. SIO2G3]|nr:hypothetical protein [Microcoleus sp. SIO2G3]
MIELGILYLVIRPWSFRRSWVRCLGAMTLFFPWTFLMMFITMHGGGITRIHFFWLVGIDLILITLLIWTLLTL